jgi:hypothetical protein
LDHSHDRIRRHTAADVLRRIDGTTAASLARCAQTPAATEGRLEELDREWDVDRALELEAAVTGLFGLALGTFVRKEFLALPTLVASAVLLQAVTGRYPLMPLFRRLGLRTSKEIAGERYALKALRGDFAAIEPQTAGTRANADSSSTTAHPTDEDPRAGLH